jgi:hypothetical protein
LLQGSSVAVIFVVFTFPLLRKFKWWHRSTRQPEGNSQVPDRCSQIISPRLSHTLLFADDAEDASGGDDSLFSHENADALSPDENADALSQRPDETQVAPHVALAGEGGISAVHHQLMHEKEERRREQEERRREQAEMSTLKDQLRLMREKDAQQDQAR